MSAPVYSGQELAAALRKRFGKEMKIIQVKPLYVREVMAFIKRGEKAHKATAKSQLVFK